MNSNALNIYLTISGKVYLRRIPYITEYVNRLKEMKPMLLLVEVKKF